MANVVTMVAEARARAGKGAARATRRAGMVPAVIYGAHQSPNLIALEPRAVLRELQRPGWQSRLYEIKINGEKLLIMRESEILGVIKHLKFALDGNRSWMRTQGLPVLVTGALLAVVIGLVAARAIGIV